MTHTNAHVHPTPHYAHVHTNMHVYSHTNTTHTTMCIQEGNCPLRVASDKGHDKTMEILLQAGATVDLQNKVDSYYLLLLENGVHSNLNNFDGTSTSIERRTSLSMCLCYPV